jgi:hypothetical protein
VRHQSQFFAPIVNWITSPGKNPDEDAVTGWRQPISISGQGKAAQVLYCTGGLVY